MARPTSLSAFSLLVFLAVFPLFSLLLPPTPAAAECGETGNYLVCEDWDVDSPPTVPWPCNRGPQWHGWEPADYSSAGCSEISSIIKHSGTRSYRIKKATGTQSTIDLYKAVPGAPASVYLRFYVYLPAGSATCAGRYWGAHFLFLNTATTAECSLDFRNCPHKDYCGNAPEGAYLVAHTYTPGENWEGHNTNAPYFNWVDHENEWILVEWYVNLTTKKTSLWINENLLVDNYSMQFPYTSVSDVIFSGFAAQTGCSIDYYVDDIVVSTSYIGPRGASGVDTSAPTTSGHSPAKNATGVAADTNISLHVLDSGDGVNRSSIVMTVNGQTVTPTITGSPADYTVSYNPPVDFSPGQTVTVTLDASDLHNPPNVMPRDSYRFTVAADTTPPAAPTGVRVNVQ